MSLHIASFRFASRLASTDGRTPEEKESIFDKLPSSLDISKLFTHKPNTSVAKSEEPVEHNITDTSEVEPSTNTNTECNLVETVAVAETATVDETVADTMEPELICDNTIAGKETAVISEDPLDKEIEEFLKA